MRKMRFEKWLRNIGNTQEAEISCSECFDQVSRYVEMEVSGGNPAAKLPLVKQHLAQCRACRDEYEVLHDLRQLEEQGISPSVDDLKKSIH